MSLESGGISVNSLKTLESLQLKKQPINTAVQANTESKKVSIKVAKDIVISSNLSKGSIPENDSKIANEISSESQVKPEAFTFSLKNHDSLKVYPLTEGIDLQEALSITKDNDIDQVFLKNEEGKLYIAYGEKNNKGSLELDSFKEGFIGKIDGKPAKIVKIDNKTNTMKEGAINPLKSTWATVRDAGANGIGKGIGEIGGSVVALVLSGSVITNIVHAAKNANEVTTVATTAGKTAKALIDIGKAGKTGKVIIQTIGSGLKQGATYAVVAGALVGTVALGFSAYGIYKARNPKNDFTSIDAITDPTVSFHLK